MNNRKVFKIGVLALATSGLMALSACNDWDMTPKSDFAEKSMQRHLQNGEMNDYQYQDNLKVFQRPTTTPSASTATAAGTGTSGSTTTTKP